ncbi:MAG: serine/threonine-protein kinase, partial [Kofleriaceae bacterium]
ELADDPRIVEMFLDEARIGALLNHPNIVHVYDVDEHDGIPYIAMEYIVGEELNELCRRGIAHGRFLPIEHAVELIRQAAHGMGYFHAKRGGEGTPQFDQPLEIVHLDISPTNLLVTQDGTMKVIDFGIARARGQRTRTDVIPGKLSYMSPEQASRTATNASIDYRSDIFSLGIVLYEITVGKRLFRGSPAEVVPKLVSAEIEPPTFARRGFPAGLESIVMRALEKHPDDRYQSAYDLADDLETFMRDERLHSGSVRIARYLDMLTHAGGGQRRPELVSEAEARIAAGHDDLDFDSQVFDGFQPSEGAPGPEQAREWEDTDQPEGEVALALGMELAELRALRTPVPVRPSGMTPVTGAERRPGPSAIPPDPVESGDDLAAVTNPRAKIASDANERPTPSAAALAALAVGDETTSIGVDTSDLDDDTVDGIAPPPMLAGPSAMAHIAARPAEATLLGSATRGGQTPVPTFGSSMLQARAPSRLPWILVGFLVVAVFALVTYIVLK